jgi:trigger factor
LKDIHVVTVQTEILENRQAKLVAEVNDEMVAREMQLAARRIAKHVNIPGYRKGKAPYRIIRQYYGDDVIFDEALDNLGQDVYKVALQQSEIEPYAPGVLAEIDRDPVVMTFIVPLVPLVDLGSYRELRLPYEAPTVDEEAVDRALEDLRQQAATLDPAERPIEMNDVVMLDIVGTVVRDADDSGEDAGADPNTWVNRADVRIRIAEDATYPVPGFSQHVVGMAAEEERQFDMSFDQENTDIAEPLRGKTLHFVVKCNAVYQHNVPELNDELAKDIGEEYETLDLLRVEVRRQLETSAEQAAREKYVTAILDHLVAEVVKIEYPPVMEEEQLDRMIEDLESNLRQQRMNLEDYMKLQNLTEEKLREDFREEAIRLVKRGLVLGEVVEAEKLKVSDAEIEKEIDDTAEPYGENAAIIRQLFDTPRARLSMFNRLLSNKALDRLVLIARGEAPEPGDDTEPEDTEAVSEAGDDSDSDQTEMDEVIHTGSTHEEEADTDPALSLDDSSKADVSPGSSPE